MIRLTPYITFKGNCREAMTFYHQCLGGELEMQEIGESPMAEHFPKEMHKNILHSQITSNHITLMGADAMDPDGWKPGNDVSLTLFGDGEEEFRSLFTKLGDGGKIGENIEKAPWGDLYGDLRDKFGKKWMFNCSLKSDNE